MRKALVRGHGRAHRQLYCTSIDVKRISLTVGTDNGVLDFYIGGEAAYDVFGLALKHADENAVMM
jgi:hypothetical protein